MAEFQGFNYVAGRMEMQAAPLLLLHGSGHREQGLISLADEIAPFRPYFSLRGRVEWNDGFSFFRRNADRSLDYDDLAEQTLLLAAFIKSALHYQLFKQKPVLVGFSNGAIMASSLLFRQPQLVSGAVLMRPLSPSPEYSFPNLTACHILIAVGAQDRRRSPDDARFIAAQLAEAGATVRTVMFSGGHDLHTDEPQTIRDWLEALTA